MLPKFKLIYIILLILYTNNCYGIVLNEQSPRKPWEIEGKIVRSEVDNRNRYSILYVSINQESPYTYPFNYTTYGNLELKIMSVIPNHTVAGRPCLIDLRPKISYDKEIIYWEVKTNKAMGPHGDIYFEDQVDPVVQISSNFEAKTKIVENYFYE